MEFPRLQLVLDTNTLLRALANPTSASGKVLRACEDRRAIIVASKPLLDEYRRILSLDLIRARHPALMFRDVEVVIRRFRYVGEYQRQVRAQFQFVRDPTDAMLIALAIDGGATHIVSHDHDLLSLPRAHTDAAKRYRQRLPHTEIVRASALLRRYPWLAQSR